MVTKSAVIGIDIGAAESFVAYVGKGVVDLVQNEVSKRATPSLVGFTDRERLLGDAALSQIRSNGANTCRNFKHLLGRPVDAPDLEKEHFWSTSKLAASEDSFSGYDVHYKGQQRTFSATQVTAMYLTKLREITEKWCQAKVADAVISVPSYFSDVHRQALLDAASIAGISVLRLMNEHTATALAYGIYRSNDFDPEKPMTVAFCSMGHSLFSVSIVQFVRGKLTVLCEKSDKVGGRDMDECLVREFASQFKQKTGADPLSNKKASFKLEDAVLKTKKILSANNEAAIGVEFLMEDQDFSSNIKRADFEAMCQPMMDRVKAVLEGTKAMSPVPLESIDSVEIVGGASRVPWVKKMCSEAFGGKDLSTTMNADESVARGCALQAAILSPLYKVRDFKVEDCSNFGINLMWISSSADAEMKADDGEDVQMGGADGGYKSAAVFPPSSQMNILKLLSFWRRGPFEVKAEYADQKVLLPGTRKELGTYKIALPPQQEAKKVKVRAKLTLHGIFTIDGAQLLEEEEYEETVKEKRELPGSEAAGEKAAEAPATGEDADAAMADGATDGEQKPAEDGKENGKDKKLDPKVEWVDVVKKKKRTKRTDLAITVTSAPGLDPTALQRQTDEETAIQVEMREVIETDEKRNDLESYIFNMRDKITASGEYGEFISDTDRQKFSAELEKAETWLYDTQSATKVQYIDKLDELKGVGEPVVWRYKEHSMRDDWVNALTGTIKNHLAAAENPGDRYGHIAPEKLAKVSTACKDLEKWLNDMQAKQSKLSKTEKPVLLCAEMEKKNQELAKTAEEILKEPKPAPARPPPSPKKEDHGKENGAKKAAAEPDEAAKEPKAADGPANMDVD